MTTSASYCDPHIRIFVIRNLNSIYVISSLQDLKYFSLLEMISCSFIYVPHTYLSFYVWYVYVQYGNYLSFVSGVAIVLIHIGWNLFIE